MYLTTEDERYRLDQIKWNSTDQDMRFVADILERVIQEIDDQQTDEK